MPLRSLRKRSRSTVIRRRLGRLAWPSIRPALQWLVVALLLAIAVLGVAGVGGLRQAPSPVLTSPTPRATNGTAATWIATGSMAQGREGHTATLLPDGRFLVAGGGVANAASSELYVPATSSWTSTGRHEGCQATQAQRDALARWEGSRRRRRRRERGDRFRELYDPGTGTWTATEADGRGPRQRA